MNSAVSNRNPIITLLNFDDQRMLFGRAIEHIGEPGLFVFQRHRQRDQQAGGHFRVIQPGHEERREGDPQRLAGDLQVVSEGRTVAAPGGVLRDHFDVYDTHLYATDPIEVRFDAPVTTAALRLLVTGNRAGQDATVVYEVEAYAE